MTIRKKCCKYCNHSVFHEDKKRYGCSVLQQYVKPMFVCDKYSDEKFEDFEFNQIED